MKKRLKIAIDISSLKEGHSIRGIGTHTKLLVEGLKKRSDVSVKLVYSLKTVGLKYDILHFTKFHPYILSFPIPLPPNSVLTIHDLIPLIYKKAYPSGIKGKVIFYIQKLFLSQFKSIITISDTSKKDIMRLLNIPADKIYVTYLAPKKMYKKLKRSSWAKVIRKKYNLPEKFALYIGDVNYNKNLIVLAKACQDAKINLVVAGKQAKDENIDQNHPENKHFVEFLKLFGKSKTVFRIGYIEDDDLAKILNLATVYVQPSLYEGFGLPVIEAMACGTPTICSRTQALVEVSGNNSLYFDPSKHKELAILIRRIVRDKTLRNTLSLKGKKHAQLFNWEKTVQDTVNAYKQAAL